MFESEKCLDENSSHWPFHKFATESSENKFMEKFEQDMQMRGRNGLILQWQRSYRMHKEGVSPPHKGLKLKQGHFCKYIFRMLVGQFVLCDFCLVSLSAIVALFGLDDEREVFFCTTIMTDWHICSQCESSKSSNQQAENVFCANYLHFLLQTSGIRITLWSPC